MCPLGEIWQELLVLLGRKKALHNVDRLLGRGFDTVSSEIISIYQ